MNKEPYPKDLPGRSPAPDTPDTPDTVPSSPLGQEANEEIWPGERTEIVASAPGQPLSGVEKSLMLDLAYEEYCQCQEAGESVNPDEFCKRFPSFKSSLRRLIEAHGFLGGNPQMLKGIRPVKWPEPGNIFLGYFLIRELGRGTFARVFLATERALGNRKVAVKISLHGSAEAETLGRLNHPNIAPVHSVQVEPNSGLTVVCMPYLGNATLSHVLDQVYALPGQPLRARIILDILQAAISAGDPATGEQPLDPYLVRCSFIDGATHLGIQLAEGLASVHAMGICHRDLKPSNVLMSPAGLPLLLDFNLSFDEHAASNRLGGTFPYMAPEQLRAIDTQQKVDPSMIDARSDLFSLGVILYELLAGTHPFGPLPLKLSVRDMGRHLLKRLQEGPRPLRQANPRVDSSLARTIERCLAWDPGDRPQSAEELAQSLRQSLAPWHRLRRWARTHPLRGAAAAILGVGLLAAIGAGISSWALQEPFRDREWKHGIEAYERGHFQQAADHAGLILARDPEDVPALFLRGRSNEKLANLDEAVTDFQKRETLVADGATRACLGYCWSRKGFYKEAVLHFTQAIDAGFDPPEVDIDLGYNHLMLRDLESARKSLDQALQKNDGFQVAYYLRAKTDLLQGSKNPRYIPLSGLADIRAALRLSPRTGDMDTDAARLLVLAVLNHRQLTSAELSGLPPLLWPPAILPLQIEAACRLAAATQQQSLWIKEALVDLADAVSRGENPQGFLNDPLLFPELGDRQAFDALFHGQPPSSPPPEILLPVDPLPGDSPILGGG